MMLLGVVFVLGDLPVQSNTGENSVFYEILNKWM